MENTAQSNERLEMLNRRAIRFFKDNKITQAAIAVSGSAESLILLNAAAYALGNTNIAVIIADTGLVDEKKIKVTEAAANLSHATFDCINVPLYDTDISKENASRSPEYKAEVVNAVLQEAWLLGLDTVAFAVTDETRSSNGNNIIHTYDGAVCPFISKHHN